MKSSFLGARCARRARPGRAGSQKSATRSSACFSLLMPNLREAADKRAPFAKHAFRPFKRVANIVCEVCGRPVPGWTREPGVQANGAAPEAPGERLRLSHRAVLPMRTRARPVKQVLSLESVGSRCVALLRHVQAAKLII